MTREKDRERVRDQEDFVTRCVFSSQMVRNALAAGAPRLTLLEEIRFPEKPDRGGGKEKRKGGEVTRERDIKGTGDGECGEGKWTDVPAS